jgi:hypothetical protein
MLCFWKKKKKNLQLNSMHGKKSKSNVITSVRTSSVNCITTILHTRIIYIYIYIYWLLYIKSMKGEKSYFRERDRWEKECACLCLISSHIQYTHTHLISIVVNGGYSQQCLNHFNMVLLNRHHQCRVFVLLYLYILKYMQGRG